METKSPLLSKTIWVNAIVSIIGVIASFGVIGGVNEWVQANSGMILTGLGVIGVALRLITKDKVVLGD